MTDAPEIMIYTVEFGHPDYESVGEMQLIATSESAAISRTRGTAFHMYKDARWLDGFYAVTAVEPFRTGWNARD
jgi:hypothetical protein